MYKRQPKVVGVRLTGELAEGVAAMDVALTFAQMLREKGVVGSFVECFGPGEDITFVQGKVLNWSNFTIGSSRRSASPAWRSPALRPRCSTATPSLPYCRAQ